MENHYVYYSYEEFGRGYIGCRTCNCFPEDDASYLGSYRDKTFHPTNKIILETFSTREEALQAEVNLHKFYQIDKNPHFANKSKQKTSGFYYSAKGVIRSEEYKKKMSESMKHREYQKEWSEKAKQNRKSFIGENNPFYGKKHSDETKELLRQKTTEIWKNQPHPWIGKKHTEESKIKFRENNKGEKNPNYGKTQSKETKEKVRAAKIGKKLWNNGEQQKFSKECPGEGWVLGGLKFKKSINNSKTTDGNE
jgi:hypothetical protein